MTTAIWLFFLAANISCVLWWRRRVHHPDASLDVCAIGFGLSVSAVALCLQRLWDLLGGQP